MTETMWAVTIAEDKSLTIGTAEKPTCGPRDVLVKVETAALNRADLIQRMGLYPPPPGASNILGLECAGTITAIGHEVSDWAVGDRVCGLIPGGGYAEFALVDQGSLFAIPDEMSFEQAGALPEALMTVWINLFDRCKLAMNESLLIHGGTSGIGTMAIQMARHAGIKDIMATAGSAEKCAFTETLGANLAINYKTDDFEKLVSDRGGADVILDMVGGDYVQKNIAIAKIEGRICNIAYMQGHKVELNLMPIMLKRLSITGSTLRARPDADKEIIRDAIIRDFWPAIIAGSIKPVIDSVYAFEDAEAAHARMSAGGHIGKILLSNNAA